MGADLDVADVAARARAAASERQKAVWAARKAAVPRPDPPSDNDPSALLRYKGEPGWVRLERVLLRADCPAEVPGRDYGIYPTVQTKLEDHPKHLRLWLNAAEGELVLEHPESGNRDRVPLTSVRQYRRVGDHKGGAQQRVVGMVRSLSQRAGKLHCKSCGKRWESADVDKDMAEHHLSQHCHPKAIEVVGA